MGNLQSVIFTRREISMWKSVLAFMGVMAVLMAAAWAPSADAAGLDVVAVIDTEVCASGAVQCGGAGHSAVAASNDNHNPLRMFVQVVRRNGLPVNGLSIGNFSFSNNLVPAGGGAAGICSEATCTVNRFGGGINGLYQIFLDRIPAGNWKAGAYAGTVRVTEGANRGAGIVTFTIPDAGAAGEAESDVLSSPTGIVEEE
jgi:hypothetical protein